ncbi:hypothetical protein BGW42_002993 [Actinomortierella wolfii]|nr:hypothetical protein BGW42_002993 [Actinomortierella wolfii]
MFNSSETEGVTGVLIADEHGLCLGARGTAKASSAGFVSSIAAHAMELLQAKRGDLSGDVPVDPPTVSVEFGNRSEGNHTLAVWKNM